ncbi:MAG: hypothetical protein HWN81_11780 [Candidatus Lokiarchaeota archaeon]|nr:hypothetical protein [Candidatus Lokiarchaeota archaeon]
MSEKSEIEKLLIEGAKLEGSEITDTKLKLIDKVIQDFAPEIAYVYQFREDESEEQQIKTGRLHENRILGIILKFYLEGKKKIKTGEVEEVYKRYFKEIARSTISTYLNMLKKESTLYKERDGRVVYYIFYENPPIGIKPFWFTRIFCIVPVYFDRAMLFSKLYIKAKKYVQQFISIYGSEDENILIRNFKFITGLIILKIFKNRSSKCVLCQFSKREIYNKLEELISIAVKDRSDVLPEDLLKNVIEKFSEIPMFDGFNILGEEIENNIPKEILRCADAYKKDLDFQIMVSIRRKDLRLKQKLVLEEQDIDS